MVIFHSYVKLPEGNAPSSFSLPGCPIPRFAEHRLLRAEFFQGRRAVTRSGKFGETMVTLAAKHGRNNGDMMRI